MTAPAIATENLTRRFGDLVAVQDGRRVRPGTQMRAELVAGGRAWLPGKGWGGLRYRLRKLLPGGIIPRDVRKRYASALREGKIVVVAAADGQPPDTIAALLHTARGEAVDQWWQAPTYIFAPPELAGPF